MLFDNSKKSKATLDPPFPQKTAEEPGGEGVQEDFAAAVWDVLLPWAGKWWPSCLWSL